MEFIFFCRFPAAVFANKTLAAKIAGEIVAEKQSPPNRPASRVCLADQQTV